MLYKKNGSPSLSKELFQNPTSEYRGAPFWSWNCKVNKEDIDHTLEDLHTMGMGGAHIHCRTGMDLPYLGTEFMDMVRYSHEKSNSLNMITWLYDEDRWPSGAAGGLVTKNPEYRMRFLVFSPEELPEKEDVVPENGGSSAQPVSSGIRKFLAKYAVRLENGYLAGDDTDSHIDTLARFCSEDTIAYVQCTDESDEHFDELQAMEQELQAFRQADGKPYRLIALPMADPVIWNGERLPATYANFLIINGAVLLPYYNSPKDELAKDALQQAFPDREIIGIDCLPLIKQHGSLHCVTMQYPEGVIS